MPLFMAITAAQPTTLITPPVSTTTGLKTLLQIGVPSTTRIKVVSWGISFDGSAAAQPGIVELLTTANVFASVTTTTPIPWSDSADVASLCVGGAALTGFNASGEGTIASTRVLDLQHIAPTSQYVREFSLGREPLIAISTSLRIRVDMVASVNAQAWIVWEE